MQNVYYYVNYFKRNGALTSVLDCISSLKSYGQTLEQECRFPGALSDSGNA